MHQAKEFSIGELVHVPASVRLTQYQGDTSSGTRVAKKYMLSDAPALGVVVSNINLLDLEVYCHGERWSIPIQSIFKIEGNTND